MMFRTTAALSVIAFLLGSLISQVAYEKKTVMRRLTLVKEPVEITFLLNGQPLTTNDVVDTNDGFRNQEFEASPDWLKNLTLKLRNVSDKTITYINVNLHFVEATKNGAMALHQVFLGVDPNGKFSRPELRLAPGESVEVPLATRYDDIRKLLLRANAPVENVSKLWVEMHAALFDDATLFEAGTLYRRDPNDAGRWLVIDRP